MRSRYDVIKERLQNLNMCSGFTLIGRVDFYRTVTCFDLKLAVLLVFLELLKRIIACSKSDTDSFLL